MIQIVPQMRILMARDPVDFRKGIDSLCQVCRKVLDADPFAGSVFVFRNRTGTGIKVLTYDGQGFWLCQKRLSAGRFRNWPDKNSLEAHELQILIWNGNLAVTAEKPFWKKVSAQLT